MNPLPDKHSEAVLAHLPEFAFSKDSATRTLVEALLPVAADLEELNRRILEFIPIQTNSAQAILKHVFVGGGKRIRPALYFLCCRLLSYRGEHYFPIAAVCEFVHAASLLHDDVVDSSTLRRNKPTANSIWGDQCSVLLGDLVYARASEMMAATGSLDIVTCFARAIRLMSEGEILQLEQVFNFDASHSDYFQILANKTSVLIGASCKSAAILAGAPLQQIEALEKFGVSIGMAFQLVDDALDYMTSKEQLGKPALADLCEGKVTFPVLLLRERANAQERAFLCDLLASKSLDREDVDSVLKLVEKYETAYSTIALAGDYTEQALSALDVFVDSPAKHDLQNVAKKLVCRIS